MNAISSILLVEMSDKMSTNIKSTGVVDLPNWKKTPYKPTPDEIIDAYEAGKKEGISESKRLLLREFGENLNKACSLSEELFLDLNREFKEFGNKLFLKVNGISSFDALFIVDPDTYMTDSRKKIFKKARTIKKKNKNDFFSINFSFLPLTKHLDYNNIFYDGYALTYEPHSKSKTSQTQ